MLTSPTTTATAPASPPLSQPDRSTDTLTLVLAGPVGDALAAWASRFSSTPDTPAAYPDSPEFILQDVDCPELARYLVAAARAHGESRYSGPPEAAVRWHRIEAALAAELGHRIEALTDTEGPF